MSYRAFKRLLGETSLERKCRFLFGAGILVLITLSFSFYAYLTEQLAKKQATGIGRLLVNWLVIKQHQDALHLKEWEWRPPQVEERAPPGQRETFGNREWELLKAAFKDLEDDKSLQLPATVREYQQFIIKPKARSRLHQPEDSFEADLLKEFTADKNKQEDSRELAAKQRIYYYGAVRAT